MMSKMTLQLEEINCDPMDKEVLRAVIIDELDALNLHEQMAGLTVSEEIKNIPLDVAREGETRRRIPSPVSASRCRIRAGARCRRKGGPRESGGVMDPIPREPCND
jgi:hypothetical protein